ncbi:MAG: preprotein translocase subunit SecG [Mycoplasmataceae bacterium]|nr:preprotein translocase subunit SecG [Mycoplasmataceae bacterium]
MDWIVYTILGLTIVAIVVGLMLSSSGSTQGLASMNGQDLELFKKTKDRGLIKWLQTIMYIDLLIVLILIVVEFAIKK